MTCEELHNLVAAYALGAVDPAEADAIRAHLATGCPQCAGALAEAKAVIAAIPLELTPISPPAHVRERIMQRLTPAPAIAAPSPQTLPHPRENARRPVWSAVIWSAMAACLAVVFTSLWFRAHPTAVVPFMSSPDLSLVSLSGGSPQPRARGRIFWDKDRHIWHVQVFDLAPLPPQKAYELWIITPARKLPSVTFSVNSAGDAAFTAPVPANEQIAAAAITDEPAGGVASPTGKIQLLGKTD